MGAGGWNSYNGREVLRFRRAMARILVIDDDPDILLIIEHALRRAGHHVVTSSDPTRVAALALEHHVDAAILDVVMPDMTGFDALKTLREQPRTGGLPILFLSARAQSEDRVRGLREGADDYMTKPFDVEELVLRIERLAGPRAAVSAAAAPSIHSANLQRALTERHITGQVYLGRYQALEIIGEGAAGMVFRGWDPRLRRPVALKTVILEKLVDDQDRAARISQLLQEGITAARLSHPNLVAVYDADADAEIAYVAMEFVEGTTLARLLKDRGALPSAQTILLGLGIARGLAAAHGHNIVHHDVKPGNVLLGRDGSIKIGDFGIAHLVQALVRADEKIFGTVGYLPPESLRGEGYDERGDLFALGAVLYECATGRRAFGGSTLALRIYQTIGHEVPPPRQLVPEVPAALDELVIELLRKDPAARIGTAAEVVERLQAMSDRSARWEGDLETAEDADGSASPKSNLYSFAEVSDALAQAGGGAR